LGVCLTFRVIVLFLGHLSATDSILDQANLFLFLLLLFFMLLPILVFLFLFLFSVSKWYIRLSGIPYPTFFCFSIVADNTLAAIVSSSKQEMPYVRERIKQGNTVYSDCYLRFRVRSGRFRRRNIYLLHACVLIHVKSRSVLSSKCLNTPGMVPGCRVNASLTTSGSSGAIATGAEFLGAIIKSLKLTGKFLSGGFPARYHQ
jgi:hypothetical protein